MPKILFAEDGPTVMDLSAALFDDPNTDLDVVTDGRSALDRLNANPKAYDLVILGLDLPEIDGLGCVAYIKKMFRRIPVLVLSNGEQEDAITELAGLGIRKQHIIEKPIDRQIFAIRVREALSQIPPLPQIP